jgi:hypothetical protein
MRSLESDVHKQTVEDNLTEAEENRARSRSTHFYKLRETNKIGK